MDNPTFLEQGHPIRPPTPQTLYHRAPESKLVDSSNTPQEYIVLLLAPTSVAGKVQIATEVSQSLGCPLYQGDSLFESCSKAASVAVRNDNGEAAKERERVRFKRMWFNKLTRTGLLFPQESRPVYDLGVDSKVASAVNDDQGSRQRGRSGSTSSTSSALSSAASAFDYSMAHAPSSVSSFGEVPKFNNMSKTVTGETSGYVNTPVPMVAAQDHIQSTKADVLMVLTHPEMEPWHRNAARETLREYGIGIIFVPLFGNFSVANAEKDLWSFDNHDAEEEEPPVLRPLDLSMLSSFTSFDALRLSAGRDEPKLGHGKISSMSEEMVLEVDIAGTVEKIIDEIVEGVENIISIRPAALP